MGVDKQKKTPRTRNGNDNASSSHPAAFAQSPRKSSAMPTCTYTQQYMHAYVQIERTKGEHRAMKIVRPPRNFTSSVCVTPTIFPPTTSPTSSILFPFLSSSACCRRSGYRIGEEPSCFLTRFAFHARGSIVRFVRGNRTITGHSLLHAVAAFFFFASFENLQLRTFSSSRRNFIWNAEVAAIKTCEELKIE